MEYGSMSIQRLQSGRWLNWGIRFFLTAALTASQTAGGYAPFALGCIAAAGPGADGAAALLGSVVGTAATLALVPAGQAAHGLGGYSPCLTAIAIGVVLLPPGRRAWVLAVVGSVLTVVVDRVFTAIPVPTYTWPFIVTTWLVLAVVKWRERRLG